ncbi:hypothetical protein [Ferrovibrio sp.]|uniref:hypothetical protein n=1 Tax=Ferrovibrio sp. TaxID=1917215 RepID=UPI0035B392C9
MADFSIDWSVVDKQTSVDGRHGVVVQAVLRGHPDITAELFVELLSTDVATVRRMIAKAVEQQCTPPFALQLERKSIEPEADFTFAVGMTGSVENCCADCAKKAIGLLPADPISVQQIEPVVV